MWIFFLYEKNKLLYTYFNLYNKFYLKMKMWFIVLLTGFGLFITLLFIEAMIARSGYIEIYSNPQKGSRELGQGKEIIYFVFGDSTAAGQGADYDKGIAVQTSEHLAEKNKVIMYNFAVSGAIVKDVLEKQIPQAELLQIKPDVILFSVGANDVTALTSSHNIKKQLAEIKQKSIQLNCNAKMVFTASADMGTVPRVLQPLRWIMGLRSHYLNYRVFYPFIQENDFTLAPIARETGPIFKKNPELFGKDKYHPNNEGYPVWTKVINKALDEALSTQPSHCQK
jgi:lysophospholipase L1-like esterase